MFFLSATFVLGCTILLVLIYCVMTILLFYVHAHLFQHGFGDLHCWFCFAITLAMIWGTGDMIETPLFSKVFVWLGSKLWSIIHDHLFWYAIMMNLGVLYDGLTACVTCCIQFPKVTVIIEICLTCKCIVLVMPSQKITSLAHLTQALGPWWLEWILCNIRVCRAFWITTFVPLKTILLFTTSLSLYGQKAWMKSGKLCLRSGHAWWIILVSSLRVLSLAVASQRLTKSYMQCWINFFIQLGFLM